MVLLSALTIWSANQSLELQASLFIFFVFECWLITGETVERIDHFVGDVVDLERSGHPGFSGDVDVRDAGDSCAFNAEDYLLFVGALLDSSDERDVDREVMNFMAEYDLNHAALALERAETLFGDIFVDLLVEQVEIYVFKSSSLLYFHNYKKLKNLMKYVYLYVQITAYFLSQCKQKMTKKIFFIIFTGKTRRKTRLTE